MAEDNKFKDAKVYLDGQELGEVKEIKVIQATENNNLKEPISINPVKPITIKVDVKCLYGLSKTFNKIIESRRLYNILIKTRKPRIKKKLFKRIMKVFEA